MINISPQPHNDRVLLEYRLRVLALAGLFSGALFIIAIVSLTPSYSSLKGSIDALRFSIATYPGEVIGEKRTLDTFAETINKRVNALVPGTAPLPVEDVVVPIQAASKSVVLEEIIWEVRNEKEYRVRLTGIAGSREVLKTYIDTLRTIPRFSRVDVPLSSFIKGQNIQFKIDITL